MTESQATICEWADATFGPPVSDASIAARALHEMAELVTACVYGESPERIGQEIADVVIVLARLGRSLGIDVIQEIHDTEPDADPDDPFAVHASPAVSALAEALTAVELRDLAWARSRVSDVICALVGLAERVDISRIKRVGVDIPAAIDAKMAINRARRWSVDGRGHGEHVEGV